MNELKYNVCICKHLDADHRGYNWFHCTGCKVSNCPCEKFRLKAKMNWDEAWEQGVKEGCLP